MPGVLTLPEGGGGPIYPWVFPTLKKGKSEEWEGVVSTTWMSSINNHLQLDHTVIFIIIVFLL